MLSDDKVWWWDGARWVHIPPAPSKPAWGQGTMDTIGRALIFGIFGGLGFWVIGYYALVLAAPAFHGSLNDYNPFK